MINENETKYLSPILYTLVWLAGLFIGIGYLPDAKGPLRIVVISFTAYGIGLVNAFIDFWEAIFESEEARAKPMIAFINIFIFFSLFIAILMARFFVITNNDGWFFVIAAIMAFSYFGMEMVKYNRHVCFSHAKGEVYRPYTR